MGEAAGTEIAEITTIAAAEIHVIEEMDKITEGGGTTEEIGTSTTENDRIDQTIEISTRTKTKTGIITGTSKETRSRISTETKTRILTATKSRASIIRRTSAMRIRTWKTKSSLAQ